MAQGVGSGRGCRGRTRAISGRTVEVTGSGHFGSRGVTLGHVGSLRNGFGPSGTWRGVTLGHFKVCQYEYVV
eukprot:801228-Prorocentrum_minimum.AAC.1